jgi:SecD/SecF fusion protein
VTRATTARVVLALIAVAVSGWLVADRSPRLGMDLRGGTEIVLQTRDGEFAEANEKTTNQAMEVMRRRVDALGVGETTLVRSGEKRIIVELPGVTDPKEALDVIGRTAQLTFRPVLGLAADGDTGPDVIADERGQRLKLGPAAVSGQQVKTAEAQVGQFSEWQVRVDFQGDGEKAWRALTGKAACAPPGDPTRRVAIVLDDKVISSPQVEQTVTCDIGIAGGSTVITGSFDDAGAKDLALLIRAGALPVPVDVLEQRTVGPTLGQAAIDASWQAAVLGMVATVLFIIAVYRLVGGVAAISLVAYGLISYAVLLAIGATLTLPGLAGFVLAIGMAVDANVLVFERAREERGKSTRVALRSGFTNAWSAIADSNVTTLLAAGLLFFLASGPVRGFGVTLSIGVIVSMFTALVLARGLAETVFRGRWADRHPKLTGIADVGAVRRRLEARKPDLMRRRTWFMTASAVAALIAVLGIGVRGLDLGVEFTGGRLVEYRTTRTVSADQARAAVTAAGLPRAVVNTSSDNSVTVRAGSFDDQTKEKVRAKLGAAQQLRDEKVGPSLGSELRDKALIALGVALAAQLAYLAVRFRWQWGAAAVTAMFHDVLLLVGVFAWLGKPIDGVFLAALLTVVGYSVNDSVVVFDRIRELVKSHRRTPFPAVANLACLQTVPRTVNTGLGAVFILVALLAFGGRSLMDFALALLIGILVGTYSSMFLATPLAVTLESRPRGLADPRRVAAMGKRPRRPVPRVSQGVDNYGP